jgi:predicted nucleic acid-binding protein
MMVHLDTSVLIDSFAGHRKRLAALGEIAGRGDRPAISSIVLYEWLRGPRTHAELTLQEELLPREQALAFGSAEAAVAARLYASMKRSRGREADIAIASCAIVHGAALWTVNRDDFKDIPDLRLV